MQLSVLSVQYGRRGSDGDDEDDDGIDDDDEGAERHRNLRRGTTQKH